MPPGKLLILVFVQMDLRCMAKHSFHRETHYFIAGVNVNELEDINTPSPPQHSPISKQSKINSKPVASTASSSTTSTGMRIETSTIYLNFVHNWFGFFHSTATKKGGLLTLPMPPMVPGSEDLSGDDEYISSPISSGRSAQKQNSTGAGSSNSARKEVKRKRPTILNRRNSRSQTIKDWGERCVDVFEVIAQIGEGTYGQVCVLHALAPLLAKNKKKY